MPLDHSKSNKAFKANVSQLHKDGYPIKQALAISYSILRGQKHEEFDPSSFVPKSRAMDLHVGERCWKGYKPTPGKKPYEKGSCMKEDVPNPIAIYYAKMRDTEKTFSL
jgi:hypothetical protein